MSLCNCTGFLSLPPFGFFPPLSTVSPKQSANPLTFPVPHEQPSPSSAAAFQVRQGKFEGKNRQVQSFLFPTYAGLKDGWRNCRKPATRKRGTTQTLHIGISSTACSGTQNFFLSPQNLRILKANLALLTHFQHPVSGPSWYVHVQSDF